MRHLFVSPHPDDAALSCGGLIVQLADAGETVDIVTVFSGSGPGERLTPYQRLALGFGEEHGEHVEASGPASGPADRPATGTADSASVDDGAPTPFAVMSLRRAEDRAYARMAGASIVHLDLPDAVFRDYAGDEQLIGEPRSGDRAPIGELRVLVADLGPDHLYLPLAIGSHVDHRLARRAGLAILSEPGIRSAGSVRLYEDFPYAHNVGFEDPATLDAELAATIPAGRVLAPEIVSIVTVVDRKVARLQAYPSQLGRIFGGDGPMARSVRERAELIGRPSRLEAAERYWRLNHS